MITAIVLASGYSSRMGKNKLLLSKDGIPMIEHLFGKLYKPLFAVDNNDKLWGSKKNGILIYNPNRIKDIPKEERLVIICSRYYEEIGVQLQEMKDFQIMKQGN